MSEFVASLYKQHGPELAAALALSTGSREVAHDLTHEVFLRARAAQAELHQEEDPRPWLYRTAYGLARRRLKLPRQRYEVTRRRPALPARAWEEADELRGALARLSPRRRDAIVLRDYAGLETSQVAAALGISEEDVRTDLQWGRAELDELLDVDAEGADREAYRKLVESATPVHEELLEDLRFLPVGISGPGSRLAVGLVVAVMIAGIIALFRPGSSEVGPVSGNIAPTSTLAALRGSTVVQPTPVSEVAPAPTATLAPGRTRGNTPIVVWGASSTPFLPERRCYSKGSGSIVTESYEEYGFFASRADLHTPHVIVATVQDVEPARWSTRDGCEPAVRDVSTAYPSLGYLPMGRQLNRDITYRPLRLSIERTLVNRLLVKPGVRYALYGGAVRGNDFQPRGPAAPVRQLKRGHRYVLHVSPIYHRSEMGASKLAEPRALLVMRALEVDKHGRVAVGGGKTLPLATVVRRIQEQVGPRALTPGSELPAPSEWANLVKLGGVLYQGSPWGIDSPLTDADLGREYGKVRRDVVSQGFHLEFLDPGMRDGDSTGLQPGTPVYTVKSYDPRFRLAVHAYGRLYVYDALVNPRARKGSDLLDIEGKVRQVRIERVHPEYGANVRKGPVALTSPGRIKALVDLVLDAPVTRGSGSYEQRPFYLVTFDLKDGTSLRRIYYSHIDELSAGYPLTTVINPTRQLTRLLEAALR